MVSLWPYFSESQFCHLQHEDSTYLLNLLYRENDMSDSVVVTWSVNTCNHPKITQQWEISFVTRVKGLKRPLENRMQKINLLIILIVHTGKTITVFSFRGSRRLRLFCPRLKPLLAFGHSRESELRGPIEGSLGLTPLWTSSLCAWGPAGNRPEHQVASLTQQKDRLHFPFCVSHQRDFLEEEWWC